MASPQPPIVPGPDQPYRLGDLMPSPVAPAQGAAPNVPQILMREVQMMQASGWRVHHRGPAWADFTSTTPATISTGVHIILTVFTVGAWLVVWVLMELLGGGSKQKWCRLIIDEQGQPQYQEIGRPKST